MAEENERISYEMWISWHKINGDLISGPGPFRPNAQKNDSAENPNVESTAKIYRHSRPTLHKMLADQVERVGLTVEYGNHVLRYQEDPNSAKACVILENNDKIEADLVIAADGIGSKSYSITLGHEARARPTGVSMYRALLPIKQALVDPIIDEKFPMLDNGMASTQLWMGLVPPSFVLPLLDLFANRTPEKMCMRFSAEQRMKCYGTSHTRYRPRTHTRLHI